MTVSKHKPALLAAAMLAVTGTASADLIYLDIGTAYGATDPSNCATCTGDKTEATILYDSSSTVTDTNGDGVISAGDTISTNGGLGVALLPGTSNPHAPAPFGGIGSNLVTGFNPGTFSNDYGIPGAVGGDGSWVISFNFTGLAGSIASVTGGGVPLLAYGPGTIEMLVSEDGTTFNNFMDIDVTFGGSDGLGTAIFGTVDFTNVDAGYNNLFHMNTPTCGGLTGFYDIWSACGDEGVLADIILDIMFEGHFDTNVLLTDFVGAPGNDGAGGAVDVFYISSNHDGSFAFSVPAPGSLALLGLGLAGLGLRRKRA